MQASEKDLSAWEDETLLDGKYDDADVRLVLTAGAGGTEAQDWGGMLLRM